MCSGPVTVLHLKRRRRKIYAEGLFEDRNEFVLGGDSINEL
jgi:hypothetical protein